MCQQGEAGGQVGQQEVEAEGVVVAEAAGHRHQVEGDDAERDDDALPHLQPVDAGQDVDGVGAEDGQQPHVGVVEQPEVDGEAEERLQQGGHHHLRPVGRHVVHHQQRQARHASTRQLFNPS